MKCPKCGYEHGWNGEQKVTGEQGDFFKLPIQVTREVSWSPTETAPVYACPAPACGILFKY